MNIEETIQEIIAGLKGDGKEDLKYLLEQSDKYKGRENSQEILRAIGRIIYEVIPENLKENFDDIYFKINQEFFDDLEQVEIIFNSKDLKGALTAIENVIKKIEDLGWFKEDQLSTYHCFNNPLEEILYNMLYKHEKIIRILPGYYSMAYYKYGLLLFENKQYKEAIAALKTAEKYNPMDLNIKFKIAEIFKYEKNWSEYLIINKKIYECAYTNEFLCRYYQNIGYYYIEHNNFDLAINIFAVSLLFFQIENTLEQITEDNKLIQYNLIMNQVENISLKTKEKYDLKTLVINTKWYLIPIIKDYKTGEIDWKLERQSIPEAKVLFLENIKNYFEDNDLCFGANVKILSILKELGQTAINNKSNVFARLVFNTLFGLTNNEHFLSVIKYLPKTDRDQKQNEKIKKETKKTTVMKETVKKRTNKTIKDKKEAIIEKTKSYYNKSNNNINIKVYKNDGTHFFDIISVKKSINGKIMGIDIEIVIFETTNGIDFVKINAPTTMIGISAERVCGEYLYPDYEKNNQGLFNLNIDGNNIPCDEISFMNKKTKDEKYIYFDISSFFGKM